MRVQNRASILQDLTHHTFLSCFLHILGAEEKSSPQETKGSISFSASIGRFNIALKSYINIYTPLLYSKIGVYRGIHNFLIFSLNIDCGYSLEPP